MARFAISCHMAMLVMLLTMGTVASAQSVTTVSSTSSSSSGGTNGPCQSSSQPDVCTPVDVPEPESGVVFAMGISTFLLSQWLRRRYKK